MVRRASFDVSVVIPLFNKADYVRAALESVLRQSHSPREIIVVDDGSTDEGVERIRDLAEDRIRIISQENAGPSAARNRGVAEATSSWIAFLDADDIWLEDHLEVMAEVGHAFPQATVIGSNFARDHARSDPRLPTGPRLSDFFLDPPPGAFCASSVAVKRSILGANGGFKTFWPGEDVELWARLALDHQIAISPRTTVLYRQQTGGLMDQSQGPLGNKMEMQPIFDTLDAALANNQYAPRHRTIARYRDQWLAIFARQALVAGRPEIAAAYLQRMQPGSKERGVAMPVLAKLPGPLLRAAMRLRSALRKAQR